VTLAVSGKTIRVDEQQSLLEAIEAAGVDRPISAAVASAASAKPMSSRMTASSFTTTTG